MVRDQNVEAPKSLHTRAYEFRRGLSSLQIALLRGAVGLATLADQLFRRRLGLLVIKENPRAGFDKHSHRGRANPARPACDQGDFAIQRQAYWHRQVVSSVWS